MNKTIKLLVAFIFVFSTVYYANGDLRNNLPAAVQGQLMPASTIEGKQAILNNVDVKKSASMDECATTEHDGEIKNLRPDEVRVYRAFLKLVKNTLGTTIDETTKILSESKTDKWEVYKIPPYLEAYVDRSNYKTEITRDRYQSRIAKVDKGNLNLTPIGHREKRKIEKNKHRIDDLLRPSDFKWQ